MSTVFVFDSGLVKFTKNVKVNTFIFKAIQSLVSWVNIII